MALPANCSGNETNCVGLLGIGDSRLSSQKRGRKHPFAVTGWIALIGMLCHCAGMAGAVITRPLPAFPP
jgi:hypothetical protein